MNAADFPNLSFPDALDRLRAMPAVLEAALAGASAAQLHIRVADDGFCLVEQACHLRDLERQGYLARVRRILAEEMPVLEEFDGAAVARASGYLAQDARAAARDFAAARREVVALLAPLGEAELARSAMFGGKRITLAGLVAMMCEHDRGHRVEIEALVDAMEAP